MPDIFSYDTYNLSEDRCTASFRYSLTRHGKRYELVETLRFPIALRDLPAQSASLRALHLALGISYYKIFLPGTINQPYAMDEREATFWNNVWHNGLGEFLYVNKIPPSRLAKFAAQDGITFGSPRAEASQHIALLGIGGGKDSIVAGESLKRVGLDVTGFVMATGEQRGQAQAVADTMGVNLLVVERSLDRQLLELQELPGARRGHVPISLIFGLVGTALAIALDAAYVVAGNEASASIPRVTWEHGAVNHQWSKSFEFELQLQQFVQAYIAASTTYFSAVRPLTSVAIAKLFALYPQYFEVFTSDNSVFRIDPSKRPSARWSLESPKSLSSFILLSPWLGEADLLRAFSGNFLDETSLETLFLELTGQQGEQPLDCVGTVDELVLSLNLAVQQGKFTDSHLVKVARTRGMLADKDWRAELRSMLSLQPEAALPPDLSEQLTDLFREELQ